MQKLLGPLKSIHKNYVATSLNKPFITAMITGGSILTISDFTAQKISSRFIDNYVYDYRRTIALGVFGTFYYGLIARSIYFVYERFIGPGRPVIKSMIDCCVHTPFLLIPCFYYITGTIKGQKLSEINTQLKSEWFVSSTGSVLYWIPIMWFNFRYCTPETRIFFIATLSFLHKTALSWYSNRNRMKERLKMLQEKE
eukprot:301421_1